VEAVLEYRNVIGYVLLVALAALIVLRLRAGRGRRMNTGLRRRVAAERLAERRSAQETDRGAALPELPGKRMSFGEARLQFYVMVMAALAMMIVWLVHQMA